MKSVLALLVRATAKMAGLNCRANNPRKRQAPTKVGGGPSRVACGIAGHVGAARSCAALFQRREERSRKHHCDLRTVQL